MLADEPRPFIKDSPVVVLKLEMDNEVVETEVNDLHVTFWFLESTNLEVYKAKVFLECGKVEE